MNLTTFQYEIGELHYSSSCELLFLGFGIAHLILSSIASKIHDTTSLDNILFSQQQLTKHLPDCVQGYKINTIIILPIHTLCINTLMVWIETLTLL